MGDPIHIAITRHVRKECVREFESALAEFASLSLAVPGSRGVHLLHPAPDSGSTDYGILRSFASTTDRDAFYQSSLYRGWLTRIEPMVEGEASYRNLGGLEAWFRDPHGPMPPRWKMALLTWLAVWPVSMAAPAALIPFFGPLLHPVILAGVIAAGIVAVLTWMVMPLLVRIANPWIHPKIDSFKKP